jgi:hypothetical protein
MKKIPNRKPAKSAGAASAGDMPKEIDFSGGTRGRFYRPNARLRLPVYLDADVQAQLGAIAARKGMSLSDLTNDLLKKDIDILEMLDADAVTADE